MDLSQKQKETFLEGKKGANFDKILSINFFIKRKGKASFNSV
jgi:hypothetical protein